MRKRFVLGLAFTAVMLIGSALPAHAKAIVGVEVPPAPDANYIRALLLSMVPATPSIPEPSVPDPDNLQLPQLPYAPTPSGLAPALGVLAPSTVVTCTASYLGPLVGIVALTAALDALPTDPPVQPSFINPLFSLTTTACILAPYPEIATGADADIQSQLTAAPTLPAAGPVPSVDPFAFVPAPLASVVVMAQAVEKMVDEYVYQGTIKPKLTNKLAKQLDCKAAA